MADFSEQLGVARKKADRVEARRHRCRAFGGDAAEAWPQAVEPGEGRWHPDRTAGIAAEREVAHFARDGSGGAAGRASGDVLRRARIDGLAVMNVRAEHAVEEFVAD